MYCKKCGKFLAGNENFCSNCGSKVEVPDTIETENMFNSKNEKEDKESIKIMSPIDDIVWDLKEFPSNNPRKTEDTNIRWRSDDMFLHKEIKNDNKETVTNIMDNEEIEAELNQIEEEKEKKKTRENIEIPDIFRDKPKEEPKRSFVTRNTAPIEPDYLKDDKIVEIEQPSSGLALEVTEGDKGDVKVERVIVDEPEMTTAIYDEIKEPKKKEEPLNEPELEIKSEVEEVKEPQKSLFDEIAPSAVNTLEGARRNDEKKQIDKFYTFNRKKEEFQKLLDKEYERIERKCEPGGFEDDISGFMEVETGTAVEGTSQLEEMVRARELFFDDPYYIPKEEIKSQLDEESEDIDEGISVQEIEGYETPLEAEEPMEKEFEEFEETEEDDTPVTTVVFEPESDEPLSASLEKKEEKIIQQEPEIIQEAPIDSEEEEIEEEIEVEPEVAKVIIEPSAIKKEDETTEELAKAFFDQNEEEHKRGTGTKIAIWILSIIIVLVAALLVIRIAMPDTVISRYMDKVANNAVSFFQNMGGEDTDKESTESREELVEDKSGLIQKKIDSNYNGLIKNITYNENAKYDPNKKYSIANLKDPKEIQKNLWFEDQNGTPYYYDEEIVGTIIAYESQKIALINDKDKKISEIVEPSSNAFNKLNEEIKAGGKVKLDTLEIGEIKVAGNGYYVWVNEIVDGKSTAKVYEIKESDGKLLVSDVSEA